MIAIMAPYGRNEATVAAIRLADLGISNGIDVNFVAIGPREQAIHPFWDAKVVRADRRSGLYLSVLGCTHCVWFVCDEHYYDMATLVASKAKHVLVPSWHHLTPDTKSFVTTAFDTIICPTKLCHHLVRTHVFDDKVPSSKTLTWGRWDAGLPLTVHEGLSGNGVRLLVACDTHCIDECGLMTLRIVNQLLEQVDHSRVTVMCTKTWSKRDRGRIRSLVDVWRGRLTFVYPTSLATQTHLMQTHDWCLIPSVRADFGLTAARANACGLPVIAYDVSPFSELITNNINGILVPCELGANWMQAPMAAPSSVAFVEKAIDAFKDRTKLFRLQSSDWHHTISHKAFADLWLTVWGMGG